MSRRFGGNKLTADFRGEPMILRILAATEGLFARRVVVTRHEEVARLCTARGAEVILHDLPYRSDTVRLGLTGVGEVAGCMFCAADQPLLTRVTICALLEAARRDPGSIWRPCFEGEAGAPVLFPAWAFDELMRLPQGKGGGYVARRYPERVRTVPVQNRYELMDADDRETLALLAGLTERE